MNDGAIPGKFKLNENELTTTVVGSFPEYPRPFEIDESRKHFQNDPFEGPFRRSIEAQISAGVDIISDGQTRADMVSLFTRNLGGFRMKDKWEVIGDVSYRRSITVDDQVRAKGLIGGRTFLKGIITGPFTIFKSVRNLHYEDADELIFDLAGALNEEARKLSKTVDVLQFDEPFLSVDYYEKSDEMMEKLVDGVDVPISLHVCGDVSDVISSLNELPVDILDHEFAKNPHLIEAFGQASWEKSIGYGCVRSDDTRVETVSEIEENIRRILKHFPAERILPDPDCGLGNLDITSAMGKLENMTQAVSNVREELP